MGTRTLKIYVSKEDFPSSVTTEKCLNLVKNMWVEYVKGVLKAAQTTIESPSDRLSEKELNEVASENSFECEAFTWKYLVDDEPTCITGQLILSCPEYTPQIIGNTWGSPSQYPWIKFSETFSNE
ncbi:hypothetical protein QT972_09925 [Microcoleus sp. herbarium7]|uniref:hypothetical protein n=1 Tax=Microcoleus sp. herbarium7 TaxID=3055435 RepID=UPI002FD0B972